VGLTATFVRASGRFNLPLSWILSPSGVSVDLDNDGTVDNADLLDGKDSSELGVPSGIIAMFDTDCPADWTRVSALDGKFLVGGSSYSAAAGGSNTHTHGAGTLAADSDGAHYHIGHNRDKIGGSGHGVPEECPYGETTVSSHTYRVTTASSGTISSDTFCNTSETGAHTHTISGSTGSEDNRPAFATIVVCKKD